MTKEKMLEMLDSIPPLLDKADETIETTRDAARAIGSLIIAIDHLREVVKALAEKESGRK